MKVLASCASIALAAACVNTDPVAGPVLSLDVDGAGHVQVPSIDLDCARHCEVPMPALGADVTAIAFTDGGARFVGWEGAAWCGTATCAVGGTADLSLTAHFVQPNFLFVDDQRHDANFGGTDGADARCNAAAAAAGLPGTYVALLSTSTHDAFDHLGAARGWIRPDGAPVADTVDELRRGALRYPPRVNANRLDLGRTRVFTGGALMTDQTCLDWTTNLASADDRIAIGYSDANEQYWMSLEAATCATSAGLYCAENDQQQPLPPPPTRTGRLAFVTTDAFDASAGLAAADAQCQADARAHGLDGEFLALLATTHGAAASRFDVSGAPWVRIDGYGLTATAGSTFTRRAWDVPLDLTAGGEPVNALVWIGAPTLSAAGSRATTCQDWSIATGVTDGDVRIDSLSVLDDGEPFSCGDAYTHVLCFQR